MPRYLDPKSDLVFKKIFGQHPDLLKSFLNAVLPLPLDGLIDTLEYLPAEQIPHIPVLKRTVVDVKCKDQQGRIFIVEMQIEWTDAFMQRLLFGTATAYVKQLERGETYELLHPVYGLGLINSLFDHESPEWYHHYSMVKVNAPHQCLVNGLSLIFLELPKFAPQNKNDKTLRVLWLRFMRELGQHLYEMPPELLAVPEIKQAATLAEEAAYTNAELSWYDSYWDAISTEKTLLSGKYKEGLAEGLEAGRTATQQHIARTMKARGLLIADIMACTGLSKADIEKL
ncbi:MAG: hypothetical protein A3J38_02590 [Gammaproteobacteria bacterium RIFCSPHIGHO2_12_FULL_45_9]|nr:MAG: hypothetical protein A3J38_02590 [Gammaproteobacteria bacterium RIFCSPHIGHO2_12_FULL_45_9]